jgi:thiol-disulfide isomerase/thioredoxin
MKKVLIIGLLQTLVLVACTSTTSLEGTTVTQTASATATAETNRQAETNDTTDKREDEKENPMASDERSYAGKQPAPEFPPDLDWLNTDRPLTLNQLKGKVVILDFWTYGCINCMHVIPDLKRLEAEYPDELVVIGVHSAKFENEGDTDNIRQIILRYELEHPVVNDKDFRVWHTWGTIAWPTLVIIDPAGNVVGGHSGEGIYPLFQPIIESLVREFEARGELDRTPLKLKLEKEGLPETVLSFPGKVLADAERSRLFIADTNHNRFVVADLGSGEVLDVIGGQESGFEDGDFRTATFNHPQGMALSTDGDVLYVADTENHALRQVDLQARQVTTLAGTGVQARTYPPQAGVAPDIALNSPWDLELDEQQLYIAMAGAHQLWVMDLASQAIGPFAGNAREGTRDDVLADAELAQPSSLALDGQGRLYFADSEGSSIRWAETETKNVFGIGRVRTLVGSGASLFDFGDVDGAGRSARLQHPLGVTFYGGVLYVADTYNSKIKAVDTEAHEIRTFLGSEHGWRDGADPLFYEPGGLDAAEGKLYVADTNNHSIRVVDISTGETRTLVLKGIERFLPSADDGDFSGEIVQLAPVEVAAGSGKVRLNMILPQGYKVNDQAPYSMKWQVENDVAVLAPDANRSIVAPQFPLELDATFKEGQGVLRGDLTVLYCEAAKESICLIERVRLEAPLKVNATGNHTLELDHYVELPEIDT